MAFIEGKLNSITNKIAKMKKLREITSFRKNIRFLFNEASIESFDEKHEECNTTYDSGPSTKYAKIVPASTIII